MTKRKVLVAATLTAIPLFMGSMQTGVMPTSAQPGLVQAHPAGHKTVASSWRCERISWLKSSSGRLPLHVMNSRLFRIQHPYDEQVGPPARASRDRDLLG